MANRYYPYVGMVDPDKYPHLAEAAEQVELMQLCVHLMWDSILPWQYLRWRRAHQVWETANAIWDREMELHKAANPQTVAVAP